MKKYIVNIINILFILFIISYSARTYRCAKFLYHFSKSGKTKGMEITLDIKIAEFLSTPADFIINGIKQLEKELGKK